MGSFKEQLVKARATAARYRADAAEYTERTVQTALTVGGGAAAGWVEKEYPGKEILGVNAGLALGGVLTVVGIADVAGKHSAMLGALGEGMLAYEAGRRVKQGAWAASGYANALTGAAGPAQLGAGNGNVVSLDALIRRMQTA